jgi:hypothetical protein
MKINTRVHTHICVGYACLYGVRGAAQRTGQLFGDLRPLRPQDGVPLAELQLLRRRPAALLYVSPGGGEEGCVEDGVGHVRELPCTGVGAGPTHAGWDT